MASKDWTETPTSGATRSETVSETEWRQPKRSWWAPMCELTSSGWLRDPTDPTLAKSPGVKLYHAIMRKYLPGADQSTLAYYYGIVAASVMTDALRHAGKHLTRASLLHAVQHLQEKNSPFFLPGVQVSMEPKRVFPVTKTRLVRFTKGRWRPFGPLQSTAP